MTRTATHGGLTAPRRGAASVTVAGGLAIVVGAAIGAGYVLPVIAAVAVGAALGVGVLNWRWSVYGLLAYLPVSGVAILATYPATAPAVLAKDALFVIPAYVGFLVTHILRGRRIGFEGAPTVLFALLVVLVLGQALNPALPSPLVGLIGIKVWLLYMPLFFLGYHLVRDRRDLAILLAVMSLSALIPALIGIVEAVLVYAGNRSIVHNVYGDAASAATQDFRQLQAGAGATIQRVPSTFSFVAQYFAFTLSMVAVTYGWWRGVLAARRIAWVGLVVWTVMVLAALTTGARGAFVFIPVLISLIVVLDRRVTLASSWMLLGPLAGIIFAAALLGTSATAVIRHALDLGFIEFQELFVTGFRNALELTWSGLGTGIDTNSATRYALGDVGRFQEIGGLWQESWWVKVVLELGLPGLLLALALFGRIMTTALRGHLRLRDPQLRAVSAGLVALLILSLIYNIKGQYLDIDPLNVYFWLLTGLLMKVFVLDREPKAAANVRD